MAKANDKKNQRLTRTQLWKLWSFIGLNGWQSILDSSKPHNRFSPVGSHILKGLCIHPDHQDTSPSAFFYVEKGYYKCHGGACEYYESNPLKLIAMVRESSYTEAFQYVYETFKPSFINPRSQAILDAEFKNQRIKQEIAGAANDLLCAALNDPNNARFTTIKYALEWLLNVRKLPKSILHTLPLGLMPDLGLLGQQLMIRQKNQIQTWQVQSKKSKLPIPTPIPVAEEATAYMAPSLQDPDFNGSVVFPLHVSPAEIGRIKLRVPQSEKKFVMPDDDFEDLLGLFGLGWAMNRSFLGSSTSENSVCLVEGEMDALAMLGHYAVTGSVSVPVFSVGGKGGSKYIEPILKSVGITRAFLVGDAPHKQGDNIAQNWLESISQVPARVFVGWDRLGMSGDIDEAMQDHGPAKVLDVLWEKREETFVQPWNWALERAAADMEEVSESDFRAAMEVAALHGKYVLNTLEREKYVAEAARVFDLNALILKREINAGDHTEDGFIHAFRESLSEHFSVIGIQKSDKGSRALVLHNRKDQTFQSVRIADAKDIRSLIAGIGGSLLNYVREYVGIPSFLRFPDPQYPDRKVVKTLLPELQTYALSAVEDLAQGAAELSQAERHSQGYHHMVIGEDTEEFIVCGKRIFRLDRSSGVPEFTQLDGPAYRGLVFDTGIDDPDKGREWYPGGLTTERLTEASAKADFEALYTDLVTLYTEAFRFKHHETTSELLAALLMSLPTMAALSRPLMAFIAGDSNSGKTSFMSTISKIGAPGIRLLYSSWGTSNFSAAGIGRTADGMRNTMCLDEFESAGDDDRGMHARKIFEMFRGLITGETERVIAQGPSGTKRETYRLPVFFAATKVAERAQDLNRILQIETEKVAFKINPIQTIQKMFTPERFKMMVRDLNLGMYKYSLELRKNEADIISQFVAVQQEIGLQLEWRYASNLFAPLAVMKMLGKDWKGFLKAYVLAHRYEISRLTAVSESETRLNEILYAPGIVVDPREPMTTIAKLLITPEQRPIINASNRGVFFDEETKYLLLQVDQATTLIPHHRRFSLTGPHLKSLLDRHPAAIPPKTILRCGILKRVAPFLGAGIRLQDVVVVDASRWMEGVVQHAEPKREEHGKTDTTDSSGTETSGEKDCEKAETEEPNDGNDNDEAADYNWD